MDKFCNPVVPAGADPWVILHDGLYYYCKSHANAIWVSAAEKLCDIGKAEPVCVYTPPQGTAFSRDLWAPELHYADGVWVIYVAADGGTNAEHRMYALKSASPLGPFEMVGKVASADDRWAIDGTVLVLNDRRYFIWSGWEGDVDVSQQLYIAAMSDPFTICGERVMISRPERDWECVGRPTVNEGPVALIRDGRVHIVYSASGSWCDDYCLGILTLEGNDPLKPGAWKKGDKPIFSKAETAFGPGHCSFTTADNGQTDWIVYHANSVSGSGWGGRSIRIQQYHFENGVPVLGRPVAVGEYPECE